MILAILVGVALLGAGILGALYSGAKGTITNQTQTIAGLNTDKSSLNSQLSDSKTQLTSAQSQLSQTQTQLTSTQSQLVGTQANYSSVQAQLSTIQAKYPLKNFQTLLQLQVWAASHVQAVSPTAQVWYQHTLNLQIAAMNDGFLVSACLAQESNGAWDCWCEAMIGTSAYWWDSEIGTVQLDITNVTPGVGNNR